MQARVDLHCHTTASFDSRLRPEALIRLAVERGLTHVALTDHGEIDGALRLRELAPSGLGIIVGEEIRTQRGDLIGLFLEQPIRSGLDLESTVAAIHEQGGLVGLPHPFDATRPSVAVDLERPDQQVRLAELIDYVEVHNGRVRGPRANERAAEFAMRFGIPGVAASDAHSDAEVGGCVIAVEGPIGSAPDLRTALARGPRLVVSEPIVQPRSLRDRVSHLMRGRG